MSEQSAENGLHLSDEALSQLWSEVNHDIPESFWDAAVWISSNWVTGSIDVADRKRIGIGLMRAALTRVIPPAASNA